jgi:dipeptidyl aminopeptidase/acylaminoacyl peptidase
MKTGACGAALVPAMAAIIACATPGEGEQRIETLSLVSRDARLAATLYLPAGRRPVPGVVLVHGSGPMTAERIASGNAERLLAAGLAVLAYDKRGVGQSTGRYTGVGPANSVAMFDLLAADALAGVEALARHPEIDAGRIGLVGISQGGWIAPLAASRSDTVAFVVSLSGPAVTVGEENEYSRLAGADPGSVKGLSEAEIDRAYRAFTGPHGFDPAAAIRAMRCPSLWILGARDRSIPVAHSIANLERVQRELARPITIHVVEGADHGLRNPASRQPPDFWRVLREWLSARRLTNGAADPAAALLR